MLQSVYIQKDDETVGPPPRVLKISYSSEFINSVGNLEEAVVFFAIGDYDEATYEDAFKTDEGRTFSITREDLFRACLALGIIDQAQMETHAA